MKFKRFTKPKFLKQVGRELLGKLFGRFSEDLAKKNVTLPAAELEDEVCALAPATERGLLVGCRAQRCRGYGFCNR